MVVNPIMVGNFALWNTNKTDPKKEHCLGTASKKLLEGLSMFDGTNLTLIPDVDQDR